MIKQSFKAAAALFTTATTVLDTVNLLASEAKDSTEQWTKERQSVRSAIADTILTLRTVEALNEAEVDILMSDIPQEVKEELSAYIATKRSALLAK